MALQAASRDEIICNMREQLSFQLYNSSADRGIATQIYMTEEGSPIEVSDLDMLTSELEFEMKQMATTSSKDPQPGKATHPTGLSTGTSIVIGTSDSATGSLKKIAFSKESKGPSDTAGAMFGRMPVSRAEGQRSMLTSAIPLGCAPIAAGVVMKPGQKMLSITVIFVAPGCGELENCRLTVPTDVHGAQLADYARKRFATNLPASTLSSGGVVDRKLGRSNSETAILDLAKQSTRRAGKRSTMSGASLLKEALEDEKAWQLLVATESGDIDDGVPPVGNDQQILKLGYTFFVLRLTSPLRKVSSFTSSASSAGTIPTKGGLSKSGHGGAGRVSSARILTKIHLEFLGAEKEQYVIIPCATSTLVSALVYNVIRVRALAGNPTDYAFISMNGGAVNMDERVGGLASCDQKELKMVFKSTKRKITRKGFRASKTTRTGTGTFSSLSPVIIGDNILFTKHTALARKEYRVTKINKKGKRQQRVLGIDRERLSNVAAGKNIIRKKAKKPHRLIKDVVSVRAEELSEGKRPEANCGFRIRFRGEHRELVYEAQTPDEAREIVAKISYIVEHIESISAARGGESNEEIPKGLGM